MLNFVAVLSKRISTLNSCAAHCHWKVKNTQAKLNTVETRLTAKQSECTQLDTKIKQSEDKLSTLNAVSHAHSQLLEFNQKMENSRQHLQNGRRN